MSSNNPINEQKTPLTQPNKATDDIDLNFIHAQLAYAKSKHSKAEKRKKAYYKKMWQKGRGGSK